MPCGAKIAKKNEFSIYSQSTDLSRCSLPLPTPLSSKSTTTTPSSNAYFTGTSKRSTGSAALPSASINDTVPVAANSITHAPRCLDASPRSVSGSVSLDESISTCNSLKSEDIDYIDNDEVSVVSSLERKTCNTVCISDDFEKAGLFFKNLNFLSSLLI